MSGTVSNPSLRIGALFFWQNKELVLPVHPPIFAMYPEGKFYSLPTDPSRARWPEDAESNLKKKWEMFNNPQHPGWSHLRASLAEKVEIDRTSYRLYIIPNVWCFNVSKLEYLRKELVTQAFVERDRDTLIRIVEVHRELRARYNNYGEPMDLDQLLKRFDHFNVSLNGDL